jgi:hypothetical protein
MELFRFLVFNFLEQKNSERKTKQNKLKNKRTGRLKISSERSWCG